MRLIVNGSPASLSVSAPLTGMELNVPAAVKLILGAVAALIPETARQKSEAAATLITILLVLNKDIDSPRCLMFSLLLIRKSRLLPHSIQAIAWNKGTSALRTCCNQAACISWFPFGLKATI